ncbi:Uma2 family endonuclease [Okeania sp. KiyG1]|uniref:Uma2 family endonuclease n=1 Tax=Okeania sp. KiyG1 TaxID=2720165 RepID=UPI001F15A0AF|nr:Uma2 family endonuclease [Okeania sp. KiyG1]
MDSFIHEKQQRLLTTVFYGGAETGINVPFIVAANVGLFSYVGDSGIVPDVFLSLNIPGGEKWWKCNIRSYLFWEFCKSPDIVIEIVSPTPGNELGSKLIDYAQLRIPYYFVYDPLQKLSETFLQVFQLQGTSYIPKNDAWFADVNLGLTLWNGVFENLALLILGMMQSYPNPPMRGGNKTLKVPQCVGDARGLYQNQTIAHSYFNSATPKILVVLDYVGVMLMGM